MTLQDLQNQALNLPIGDRCSPLNGREYDGVYKC